MISNETLQIIAMTGTTVGVLGAMYGAFPYLKKKGIDTDKLLDTAGTVLNATQPIIRVAEGLLPGNPAINLVDFIDKQAIKAVKGAQQLNNSSQLTGDARKLTALDSVYAALKEINIEPTENQQKLINDAIEAAVYDLPHSDQDVKQLQSTNSQFQVQAIQLQTEKEQLQSTAVQVQQENDQLKQAIATITQVVHSTISTNTETPASTEQSVGAGVSG